MNIPFGKTYHLKWNCKKNSSACTKYPWFYSIFVFVDCISSTLEKMIPTFQNGCCWASQIKQERAWLFLGEVGMGKRNDLISPSISLTSLSLNGCMKDFQLNSGFCSSNPFFLQRYYTKHSFLTSTIFFVFQAYLITQPITQTNSLTAL